MAKIYTRGIISPAKFDEEEAKEALKSCQELNPPREGEHENDSHVKLHKNGKWRYVRKIVGFLK